LQISTSKEISALNFNYPTIIITNIILGNIGKKISLCTLSNYRKIINFIHFKIYNKIYVTTKKQEL